MKTETIYISARHLAEKVLSGEKTATLVKKCRSYNTLTIAGKDGGLILANCTSIRKIYISPGGCMIINNIKQSAYDKRVIANLCGFDEFESRHKHSMMKYYQAGWDGLLIEWEAWQEDEREER